MEILQKFKQNGYFTSELYHLLSKKCPANSNEDIIPSEYEKEMKMTTSERLKNLNNIFIDNCVESGGRKCDNIVLSFTPRVIIYQNFKPNEKIVSKFSVKNISKGPVFLNMAFKESSYFSVKPTGGQLLSRLAPGISIVFSVSFVPIQYEDYTHKIDFHTDNDNYVLPLIEGANEQVGILMLSNHVRPWTYATPDREVICVAAFKAMGPRAIFNFPNEVRVPRTPLKVENFMLLTINNVGSVPAGFTLNTKCPFSIHPQSAYLNPNEKVDVKVSFKTMHLGETEGCMYASFETGENFRIRLSGTTYVVSVELEKHVIRFQDTFNTMVRQQTFRIINKSEHLLTFMCMKNDCVFYDFEEKVKLATICYNLKETEISKYRKLEHYDVLSSEEHERVYTRIFFDEIQALVADETLQFRNSNFSLSPIKGKLWPNETTELTVNFEPKDIGEFKATAYLDIDGLVDRVPISIIGTSLPPHIHLNVETLDMNCVYISKTYNYEIVAINKGHINGVIEYKEIPALFGSRIVCSPKMLCLRPGDKEVFVISFCNSNQGPYFEEINFAIRDTEVVLKLYLKGEVIYPSLTFSVPCLDFGTVSLGVPITMELDVINESVVHVNGTVKISSDGPEVSSITLRDFAVAESPKPRIPLWPKEFDIEPSKIEIQPESRVTLKVTLTANLVRANHTSLELEFENSDSPPVILPVTFNALVPEMTPAADIKLRACFIDYMYSQDIVISSSGHYGYFLVEEQEEESLHLNVDVEKKEGFIKPNSNLTFTVQIKTSILGEQDYTIRLQIFGLTRSVEICHITLCGVRPIVTISPVALHWGQVKLLTKSRKSLLLLNDSPVIVNFKAELMSKDRKWEVSPTDGYIEPESEVELFLTIYLTDADSYYNKVIVRLEKVRDIQVPLTATGVGTSIIVGELRDNVILGRFFTKIPLSCKVFMENCGTKLHSLEWSEHYKAPKTKPLATGFFDLQPRIIKMAAGEKIELTISGLSSKAATIKEMWYLVGSIEGVNKKELLLECPIEAEFVDPKIDVSCSVLDLQYDFGPYSEYYKLTDIVTIKNLSKLPLDIDISVKSPFAIIQKLTTYKIKPEDENLCACICYDETDLNVQNIVKTVGLQESKIFVDYLTLKPVEPLRKYPLLFFQDIHKIKMAFNITHAIEEHLEDQEIMKLQILFDTTKHNSLKSKIYSDLMRLKFRGHKNKDAIKLIGRVNFPNLQILTPRIDFQCISNGSRESRTIKVQNPTPLMVCFRFNWKKIIVTKCAQPKIEKFQFPSTVSLNTSDSQEVEINANGPNESTLEPNNKMDDTEKDKLPSNVFSTLQLEDEEVEHVDNFENLKLRTIRKIAPMLECDYNTDFEWISKFPKMVKPHQININEVLQLTPHRGLLKPNETQYFHVIFRPKPNINVKAILECEVLGGPPETVMVTGQSSDLMYKINTQRINFKIRSFHEYAAEYLLLTNLTQFPFEYKTYLNETNVSNELEGTILEIFPPNRVLEYNMEAEIKIIARPGVIGYFHRTFLLEIGHLAHMPIDIYGWGVIPQIYLSLNRPDISKLNNELGYLAIPYLTTEYLESIGDFFEKTEREHMNSPLLDKCFDDPSLAVDWHICSLLDGYPSTMDIELAIERMLVNDHVKLQPEVVSAYWSSSKTNPIPGFTTIPYVIDYGVIITGCTVQCTAEIVNYGPIVTKVHFSKNNHIPKWLTVKLCGKLNPGETGKLEAIFTPTSEDFTELEQNVETSFNLIVPYGVTIPIKVKAMCAVPFLMSNVKKIDFGTVRCGDKIIISVPLKNVGKPTCIWYVTLKLRAPGSQPMTVLDTSGKYEPGEGGLLRVAFQPTMEMSYEGLLVFRFHMNPNRMTIPVIGQGVVPQVHVIGPNVNFPPTLPWAETTEMYFGLTNPCPFPIELVVAHSDAKWKIEDEIYQLLYKYYNSPEELLVPALKPGMGLPHDIMNFYHDFTQNVHKALDEETTSAKAESARSTTTTKQKAKTPKGSSKAASNKERVMKKFRSEAEIIADEIKKMKDKQIDPLKACLNVLEGSASEDSEVNFLKGVIIIFHGSPCEESQCQEIAYSVGKALAIPTINIDNCIVEALCVCQCSAQMLIISALDDAYAMTRRLLDKESDVPNEEVEAESFGENEDQFDALWNKIEFLSNNKNLTTPRSKASEKKKKSPSSSVASHVALKAMGSTTMFQMDLIEELLADYFSLPKFSRGFIVDTLTSTMVKSPPQVLTTILKCKNTIYNVHMVLCQCDFSKWAQAYEETQRQNDILDENAPKEYTDSEIEEIIEDIDNMTGEEYDNISEELKGIYVTHGLEARRRKHLERVKQHSNIVIKTDKHPKDRSAKSITVLSASESKKKINKKDDLKGKPTSEYILMNSRYTEYCKNTYDALLNIANNWIFEECDLGYPLFGLNGQILGAAQKKAKKRSDIQVQMSDENFVEKGFPIKLIMCPCAIYKEALVDVFKNTETIKEALKVKEEIDILKLPINKKDYSILLPKVYPMLNNALPLKWCFLDESPIKKCECNQLNDLHLLDDSSQDNVLNTLAKWNCVCGKKISSLQTSTSEIPSSHFEKISVEESDDNVSYPLPLRSVKSLSAPPNGDRLILQPGDLIRCKYTFDPRSEGHFNVKRCVEVSGWPNSRVDVHVTAICDLPRIDSRPKKMFDNFVRRNLEGQVYKISFLDELKVFEFGPIFIGSNRVYEEDYSMNLKNSSLLTADIVIEFLEDTNVYRIDTDFITLEPGCRSKINIYAAPTEIGVHNSVLLFCVKDNPEIIIVNISCTGVVPIIEILPALKTLDYGKHLLYRREDDRIIVKNDSILPIMWKIRNAQDFLEDFILSDTSGVVQRNENQVVPVTYIACRIGVITNKPLTIDIYDQECRGEPMVVDTLFFSAECYDVMVECAYEHPTDTFLNFGNVKVNSRVVQEMYLLNRGKYPIYYKLKKVKEFPEPSLIKSFEVSSESGIVPVSLKLVTIELACTPSTSVNLSNVPAYMCSLLDGSKNQVVVAKFPIGVTIASFYNTFTLFPLGELNFHIIAVGTGIIREVILNNTSKCPVTYEIILPEQYQVDPIAPPVPVKGKDNKIKNPPIRCGNFLIMNEDSLLAPGASRTLQIQFFATSAKTFEETIKFIVSDTCPAEAQGVPLKLIGTGAIPSLDFWNIETTFREHLIVKNLNDYKVPESSPHCVFVEDSVTFHFFCVNVNTKFTGAIDLYNNGLVACALTMKLHYQSNSNSNVFSLDKYDTHIEPLMHKYLGIIFSPTALEEYRAVLEVRLKLLDNQEQTFKLCLIGEGIIPRIHMVSPPIRQQRISLLKLPVTCLGSVTHKPIKFKNISPVKCKVVAEVLISTPDTRPVFWLTPIVNKEYFGYSEANTTITLRMKPDEVATVYLNFNPVRKGRHSCDVKLTIENNPFEYYTVLCEAEAFIEDVILIGLEMLSMELDIDTIKSSVEGSTAGSTVDNRKKVKSAPLEKKRSKVESKKAKKSSQASMKQSESSATEPSVLKYLLDFGGCELHSLQKRSVIMVNNSEKVYKFIWYEMEYVVIKPSVGYISPGEEKDLEIMFYSPLPINIRKELLNCTLTAITDDMLTIDMNGAMWDNRQTVTQFDHNRDLCLNERYQDATEEQVAVPSEAITGTISIIIFYSVSAEYTRYTCSLPEDKKLKDTFIYQTREFELTVENVGSVPMKISWLFDIDEEFPLRIDRLVPKETTPPDPSVVTESLVNEMQDNANTDPSSLTDKKNEKEISKITLFSDSVGRDSVDTWFEVKLPFKIEPSKDCLKPRQSKKFKVTFSPLEPFEYRVRLRSVIDNLDPYDQNISCKIVAKSLIPYCHLDIEESDYLTSGRRKNIGTAIPIETSVLEFNVLGSGCYKKTFNVINPTIDGYEYIFEMVATGKPELIPVHCNMLKGFVEGGTSSEVTFTFSPTAPGVYESQWNFLIPSYNLVINLLVVGLVREPDVIFLPTILIMRNSLVGFTTNDEVILKNNENESLKFEFKGNSLCTESGKTPCVVEPEHGVLKPRSETRIKINYTPIDDGPLSFKIFCSITYLVKYLTLCVNVLSDSIRPKVTYSLIGNKHELNSEAVTNIHLDQTASTYERQIPFIIKNNGSATFFFDWHYNISAVKKYLQLSVEPKSGHVSPASEIGCTVHFNLKQVPVEAFPISLSISDGPVYQIFLHAEIEKPAYHFSCKNFDFGKCIVNAPDCTYKKSIAFYNDDKVPIILDMNFANLPELYIDYHQEPSISVNQRAKLSIYFRPKQVKEYEFNIQFWVNSLCEEIVTIKGEGVPLLFDLYEGCQKSFDMGPVRVGEKVVRTIQVMNHSKVPIEASFVFREMYPVIEDNTASEGTSICLRPSATLIQPINAGPSRVQMLQNYKDEKIREQIAMDIENALASVKIIPNKCIIKPYRKVPLKIHFKPVGMISVLNVQVNMQVLNFERPLVRLSGSATGMSLCFSQNSLQFGRVRRRGCKILKVMLQNKGDFGARFWWQPLKTDEFTILPQNGNIAAHTNVTFTITFRPIEYNPFIKVWASCNIENYTPLDVALYGTCMDVGSVQNKMLYMECPVRETLSEKVNVTNATDDVWLVLSELAGETSFETLKEFHVEPNSSLDIPIKFKPKTIGKHEARVLFSPLGDAALFVTLVGAALNPNPNGTIPLSVRAKEHHTEELLVFNITENPESYTVSTELVKVVPDKFDGYYEIKHPETIKTWGEAAAPCRWSFICYEQCQMHLKVMFVNEDTREYQFYNIMVTVTEGRIVATLNFTSRARETVQKEIVVANSLSTEAEYHIKCESLKAPDVIKIGRKSEAKVVITYVPYVVGETEDILEVWNQLVGTYIYKVILKCLPAKEKEMELSVPFGSSIPVRLRVQNRTELKTDFVATVSHSCIQAEKDYSLAAFDKGKFLVWLEPTEIGVQKCRLSFNSSVAGEFVFNIKAVASDPKPQGPYEVKAGGATSIKFKNVFNEPRSFKYSVDREEFYLKTFYEAIKPKKDTKVIVYLSERAATSGVPPTGCLTIECYEPPEPKVQWTYFLQGIP